MATLEPINLHTKDEVYAFCKKLALSNPYDGDDIWYCGEIVLTKKGLDLIKEFIPEAFEDWDGSLFKLNISFIEALENIFADYSVEWDENKPLIPIIPPFP